MTDFRNPYHFVPLGDGSPPEPVSLNELKPPKPDEPPKARTAPHITHDRFVRDAHSGRIVCTVTVETPLICGNQQAERQGWTKLIRPFKLLDNEPALPASALRGMLSSLTEAASHSALRILKNTELSHRMAAAAESLSAIGLLIEHIGPDGQRALRLQPLTVPTLDGNAGDILEPSFREMFKPAFSQPLLKAYIDGYQPRRGPARTEVEISPGSFIALVDPLSKSADRHEFWYAQCRGRVSLGAKNQVVATAEQRDSRKNRFLLAQCLASTPISQAQFDALPASQQKDYTRGFLRVLGIAGREREMPTTKKHEYFIPYPAGSETAIPSFEVAGAVERFHDLADQRTETDPSLPFEVRGASRHHGVLRLRAGDLVFFRPDPANATVVAAVSVSSIWRAPNGSVHQYVASVSPELTPLAPGRTLLTLAEQLFGVVENRDEQPERKTDGSAFALASRVRISHGRLHVAPAEGAYQQTSELLTVAQQNTQSANVADVPLKNLASPKPPSPSLYFMKRGSDGEYIPKRNLNPQDHVVQGRKFYLRRNLATFQASDGFVHPQRLTDAGQRAGIARQHQSVEKFVRPGSTFYFHLDFDNLSSVELQLLAYVLQPNAAFRHQLGHAKPLGFGQVKIEIAGLLEVHRHKRYRDALDAPRWHQAWVSGDPHSQWPEAERRQLTDATSPLEEKLSDLKHGFEQWAQRKELGPVLRALELLGTPPTAGVPVHYSQADQVNRGTAKNLNWQAIAPGSMQFEQEHYHWFVQNDDTTDRRQPGQFLAPLINRNGQIASVLPVLDRAQKSAPPRTSYSGAPQRRRPPQPGGGSPQQTPGSQSASPQPRAVSPAASPRSLEGREVDARAGKPEKDRRVPFTVICDGEALTDFKAYVEMSTYERSSFARKYPEATVVKATVVRRLGKSLVIKLSPA